MSENENNGVRGERAKNIVIGMDYATKPTTGTGMAIPHGKVDDNDLPEDIIEDIEDKAVEAQEAEGETTDKRTEEFRAEAYEQAYEKGYDDGQAHVPPEKYEEAFKSGYVAGQQRVVSEITIAPTREDELKLALERGRKQGRKELLKRVYDLDNIGRIRSWLKSHGLAN